MDKITESYVTKAGTLVIPKPENKSVSEVTEIINEECLKHNLDNKKISGIKNWENVIAIHF